jgi:hypothetical protein
MAYTREQYRKTGQRFGSGLVAAEAAEAERRWGVDVDVLGVYGHGAARLARFRELIAEHNELRQNRPEAVASKLRSVADAAEAIDDAKTWADRAVCVLDVAGESSDVVATGLAAALLRLADGADAHIDALVELLAANRDALEPDCGADALVAEGRAIHARLRELVPSKQTAMVATTADTEQIDVLDGRLMVMIAALNRAGRRAFRARANKAKAATYKYNHLRRGAAVDDEDAAPAAVPLA